jgi:hypothetical protein
MKNTQTREARKEQNIPLNPKSAAVGAVLDIKRDILPNGSKESANDREQDNQLHHICPYVRLKRETLRDCYS